MEVRAEWGEREFAFGWVVRWKSVLEVYLENPGAREQVVIAAIFAFMDKILNAPVCARHHARLWK